MDALMTRLGELYEKLDAALPAIEGNPCRGCLGCCSLSHVVMHRISLMELTYMGRKIDSARLEQFKAYILRKKDEKGDPLFTVCPLYDGEKGRCSEYLVRPTSCRLFGHYFLEGTSVPDECIFKDRGTWFRAGRYFTLIPFAKEFRALNRGFRSVMPYTQKTITEQMEYADGFVPESPLTDEEFPDPVDMALHLQLLGRRDEAYRLFADHEGEVAYYYFYYANLCDEMERYEEAVKLFRKAVLIRDDDSLFHFRLALDLVILGKKEEALEEFGKVVTLNGENAMAYGYLGYLHLERHEVKEAVPFLEKALSLDPSQNFFRFRLGLAYLGLGKGREAEEELLKVQHFEPVKDDVKYLLEEIGRIKNESSQES
ncbi:MAG: tetratricopeptide repeat protein [Candidatus Eremiobacteraeota bacterium]|nr:tetratricopeptide repeat protein [Candidatus Eremiobacteraeota bacterium]